MFRRAASSILAGLVLTSPSPASAVNPFFMPGDAFFPTRLSERSAAELPDAGGTVTLGYGFHDAMYGCGYAGFAELEVRDVPPEVTTGLKTLYRELRKQGYWKEEVIFTEDDGTEERLESNPFELMIYDKTFDPTRFHIGLKYNETWANPPQEAMLDGRFDARYISLVQGNEATIEDWQDAHRVAGLPAEIPHDVKWASPGAGQHPPAKVKASDVRFFVLVPDSFQQIYEKEIYSEYWEVTSQGFRRFRFVESDLDWEQTTLVVTEFPFDQPQRLTGYESDESSSGDDAVDEQRDDPK